MHVLISYISSAICTYWKHFMDIAYFFFSCYTHIKLKYAFQGASIHSKTIQVNVLKLVLQMPMI